MDAPTFSANNLALEYKIGDQLVQAVRTCDISIPNSAVTVIFGASGSGKSSLLNVISGLQNPTQGVINFKGKDLYKQSQNELAYFRAHDLGIVYQTNYWVKSLSVIDNICMPLFFQGETKATAYPKAKSALEMVEMQGFEHKYPVLLSGGEQQRVAMARALINDPPVIIADEPTGALDTKNGDMIISLLQQLQKKRGKTIILVTHNMEYLYIANHLLEIQDGNVSQIEEKLIAKTVKGMLTKSQARITDLMESHK